MFFGYNRGGRNTLADQIRRMVWAFTLVLALAACMLSVLRTNVPAFAGNNEGGEGNSNEVTVLGSDVLSLNVNTENAPIVYYAGKPWYVIAYDGTGNGVDSGSGGVTSNSGEDYDKCAMPGIITLFSKKNLSDDIAYDNHIRTAVTISDQILKNTLINYTATILIPMTNIYLQLLNEKQ